MLAQRLLQYHQQYLNGQLSREESVKAGALFVREWLRVYMDDSSEWARSIVETNASTIISLASLVGVVVSASQALTEWIADVQKEFKRLNSSL
jgi:hypothetical protein